MPPRRKPTAPRPIGRPDCQLAAGPRCQLGDPERPCRFPARMYGVACTLCYWQLPEGLRQELRDGRRGESIDRARVWVNHPPASWSKLRRLVLRLRPRRWVWVPVDPR